MAAAILYLAARRSVTIISPKRLQTQIPPILPPGKEDFELACARIFYQWRLGSVCRCLHLSKKKTCWWAEKTPCPCCLVTAAYLGSRSLPGPGALLKQILCRHAIVPISCSSASPSCSHIDVCSAQPTACLCWGVQSASPSAVCWGAPRVIQLCWQELLRLKLHFYCHSSFHSQRWFCFATLLLSDTAQLFYAPEKI